MINIVELPNPAIPPAPENNAFVIERDFLERAENQPEATALSSSIGRCNYRELSDISHRISRHLVFYGIRKNDRVVILSDRNPALVFALLGVLRADPVFNIADSAYPPTRILMTIQQILKTGCQMWATLSLPFLFFFLISSWLMLKLYNLYNGRTRPEYMNHEN
jgi:non-ribosomal peptide synthetase component F